MAFDFNTFGTPKQNSTTTASAPAPIGSAESKPNGGGFDFASFGTQAAPSKVKPKKFMFDDVQETRQEKIERYKREAAQAESESKKANSVIGFAKNAVTAPAAEYLPFVGGAISLAKTANKAIDNPFERNSKEIEMLSSSQVDILKRIRENDNTGKDSTKLKRLFNEQQQRISELEDESGNAYSDLPTMAQAAGQTARTLLDAVTAGTYGKLAKGSETGKLLVTGKTSARAANVLGNAGIKSTESAALTSARAGIPSVLPRGKAGLFTKEGGMAVLKGAATGYAGDVTYGLEGKRGEDRTGKNALIPGAGTAFGIAIPTVIYGAQSVKNLGSNIKKDGVLSGVKESITGPMSEAKKAKIIEKRVAILDQLEGNNSRVRKQMAGNQAQEAKKILASTDVLQGAVDDTGTIRTKAAIQELNDFIKPTEDVVYKNLEREGSKIPLSQVEKSLKSAIDKSGLEGGALTRAYATVDADLAGYARRADANGMIPVASIHNAKVDKYANINYLNPESNRVDKIIAKQLKTLVEENTSSVDVAAINKELSKYYAVQKLLETLEGKKVQGGKLGKYFAQTVGGIVGSHFGPVGTIVGAEIGGRIKGASMASNFADATGNNLEQSEIIKDAIRKGNSPRPALPAPAQGSARVTFPASNNPILLPKQTMTPFEAPAQVVNNPGVTFRGQSNNLGNRTIAQTSTMINNNIPPTITNNVQSAGAGVNIPNTKVAMDYVDRIASTQKMIINELNDPSQTPAIIAQMKKDIVDNLSPKGLGADDFKVPQAIIDTIDSIDTTKFSSVDDLANAVKKVIGGAGKASVGAILAGAAATGAALGLKKLPSAKIEYQREALPEKPKSNLTPVTGDDVETIKETIAHNETRGEKDAYAFSRPSGAKYLGRALGRYQVTEGELKTYADRFLGEATTAATFLRSPELQDKYIENKIKYFLDKGLPLEKILVAHRGGFSDFDKLDAKLAQYDGYVKEGLSKYQTLKQNGR